MRNLKILGLALVAVCATSVALASTAAADDFTAEVYPATVTGALDPGTDLVLGTTAGTTTCTVVQEHGTLAGPATELTMTPVFQNCVGSGFPGVFDMNGCDFVYRINGGGLTTGTMDIVCPVGQEITKTAIGGGTIKCTIHIPPQTGLGGVTYANLGVFGSPTKEITVDVNINNLKYTHTKGTGLGACVSGAANNGTLKVKTVWTGETHGGGAHVGLTLSDP